MSEAPKLTPARRRALTWLVESGPTAFFPLDGRAPSTKMIRRLRDLGLVEPCGREPGVMGLTYYRVSSEGRALLSAHEEGTEGGK